MFWLEKEFFQLDLFKLENLVLQSGGLHVYYNFQVSFTKVFQVLSIATDERIVCIDTYEKQNNNLYKNMIYKHNSSASTQHLFIYSVTAASDRISVTAPYRWFFCRKYNKQLVKL